MSPPAAGGPLRRLARRAGAALKTSLAVVGAGASGAAYLQYRSLFPDAEVGGKGAEAKKVLVVPFHRLLLRDRPEADLWGVAGGRSLAAAGADRDERPLEMATRDLVDLIHAAAADPAVVALYGTFGHGSALPAAGWADLEEVREALQVFREAHRVHPEPNLRHDPNRRVVPRQAPKALYAYADNFNAATDPGNKEYYLASAFTHVHMQDQGELSLLGLVSTQLFLREALRKYGVQLHVFKHGAYKNFPNMFTDASYNRPHREAVTGLLQGLQSSICDDITAARSRALLSAWVKRDCRHDSNDRLWRRIFRTGTFDAPTARRAGLVDHLPRRDPLPDLLRMNQSDDGGAAEARSGPTAPDTDLASFRADRSIGLMAYKKIIDKRKQSERRRKKIQEYLDKVPFWKSSGLFPPSAVLGDSASGPDEKIALVYIQGAIGDVTARKMVDTFRRIGEDAATKAVGLRVNSPGGSIFACETIAQELQRLRLPVVVSFGNVAASGGYYISAASDRIFAAHKTVTGSIGVFGVRADLTGLARQYGVTADSVATGPLAATFSALHPMTHPMRAAFAAAIDRYYDQFKARVGRGRRLDPAQVEAVAQGRVWTGDEAQRRGLVDDTGGGLHRALAYAERAYTTSGDAEIVEWPRKLGFLERLRELVDDGDPRRLWAFVWGWMTVPGVDAAAPSSNPTLNVAPFLRALRQGCPPGAPPPTVSGVFLAADETTAIECLMEQSVERA